MTYNIISPKTFCNWKSKLIKIGTNIKQLNLWGPRVVARSKVESPNVTKNPNYYCYLLEKTEGPAAQWTNHWMPSYNYNHNCTSDGILSPTPNLKIILHSIFLIFQCATFTPCFSILLAPLPSLWLSYYYVLTPINLSFMFILIIYFPPSLHSNHFFS